MVVDMAHGSSPVAVRRAHGKSKGEWRHVQEINSKSCWSLPRPSAPACRVPIHTRCGTPAVSRWPTRGTTCVSSRTTLATGTLGTPSITPALPAADSRGHGADSRWPNRTASRSLGLFGRWWECQEVPLSFSRVGCSQGLFPSRFSHRRVQQDSRDGISSVHSREVGFSRRT